MPPSNPSSDLPPLAELPIDAIRPYWRNPRRIPEEAIDAVATSIQTYGYQQPIVVDRENVVVVGHTRLLALRRLGWTSIPVYVTDLPPDKVKQYRLIDNRTAELTDWDHEALVTELRNWETDLLEKFFPDLDTEIAALDHHDVTEEEVVAAAQKAATIPERDIAVTQITCPSCFHVFDVRTDTLPGLTAGEAKRINTPSWSTAEQT